MSSDLRPPASGDGDVLVRVDHVSKKFCRSLKRSLWYGVQDIARQLNPFAPRQNSEHRDQKFPPSSDLCPPPSVLCPPPSVLCPPLSSPPLRDGEFWAVNDVSFELRRGECLGLIGRNGAGKTTLLKMLNGLIKPDRGRIEMRGRVGALIALGAGFNPILTGRENIFVNGSVLGLTKREIDEKLDEIIDFADIRDFIDTPVQSYSSGMSVRLGFAVATALEPDVLLLDEVLAVGDAGFRHKCYHRIYKLMSSAAVILVSHSMEYICQSCSAALMLQQGRGQLFPSTTEGVDAYNKDTANSKSQAFDGGKVEAIYPPVRHARVRILTPVVTYGARFSVELEIICEEELTDVIFSFTAINLTEQPVMCWHTSRRPGQLALRRGRQFLRFQIEHLYLHDGTYRWSVNAARRGKIAHLIWYVRAGEFSVVSPFRPVANIPYLVDTSACELLMAPGESPD